MTFVWHFNIILKKILEYKEISSPMPFTDLRDYVLENALLKTCNLEDIIKLGISLQFIDKDLENSIFLQEEGKKYLDLSNPDSKSEITKSQREFLEDLLLKNWILDDLSPFAIKRMTKYWFIGAIIQNIVEHLFQC